MERRVEVGFLSFTEVPAGEHAAYNRWHQFDHLPEQYRIPGIVHGERWVATPELRAARLVDHDPIGRAHYVTLYLLVEPVEETLARFRSLAAELRAVDRFFEQRESHLFGGWRVADQWASPAALVDAAVVPWRPSTGVYVVVEEDAGGPEGSSGSSGSASLAPALAEVAGVAGCWTFERDPAVAHGSWRTGPYRVAVAWLDADVLPTAARIDDVLRARWATPAAPAPVLAAPYAAITPGHWTWFDDPRA